MKLVRIALRYWRNFLGKLQGFGACHSCGDSWGWKPKQCLTYSRTEEGDASKGMFPLCRECFGRTDDIKVLKYCFELWTSWTDEKGVPFSPEKFPVEELMRSIQESRSATISESTEWVSMPTVSFPS